LNEIAPVVARGGSPAIDKKRLSQKADEIEQTIKELTVMRDGLRHAAVCSARTHLECPTFRRLLSSVLPLRS
jgi:hypothetical protein